MQPSFEQLIADSTYTAYFWVNNLYLKEIQLGIQSAHCISDMSIQMHGSDTYEKWADEGKTMIIYAGTNSGTVRRTFEILQYVARNIERAGLEIPHTIFREDEESLDGATTACGFIIPNALRNFADVTFRQTKLDTKAYHAFVTERNAQHKVSMEGRDFRGEAYRDYQHDQFRLEDFSDWMASQRLA